jgi:predicted amidohydrolase YtcJ
LTNGKVITMEPGAPVAQALASCGERIVAVGSRRDIEGLRGPATRVVDLAGRAAVPGFIEGHGHFTGVGRARMKLNFLKSKSWDEIVGAVRQAAAQAAPGQWITGVGWHQEHWDRPPATNVEGYPTHDLLSQAAPKNPVLLEHRTGHMCVANAAAMREAGVNEGTKDPSGGQILRDPNGKPVGIFRESAQSLLYRAYERAQAARSFDQRRTEDRREIELAIDECVRNGVTSFQDAGSSFTTVELLREFAKAGTLRVRLWVMLNESNDALKAKLPGFRVRGIGGERLTVGGIKRMVDGALGSHGAWLLEPYVDLPASVGLQLLSRDALVESAQIALEHKLQLCVHAIGDRANREVLDVFERLFHSRSEAKNLRWRIEHAQHVDPTDMPRFAKLGVIASMQGVHATSDGPFVVERLGTKRAREGAYAWRSLLDRGALVINGTDAPVEELSPIACFYSSVTRRLADGKEFFPEQRMSREEALRSYTLDAAYAAFQEEQKGSLAVGKLADVVVLSQDPLTVPEAKLPATNVDMTIIGGAVVYERK